MLKEKKKYYVQESGDEDFPFFVTLDSNEASQHEERIKEIYGFAMEVDSRDLLNYMAKNSQLVSKFRAEDCDFNFMEMLKSLHLSPKIVIYIDWHRFDKIDKISVEKFSDFFDDIWYPQADDMFLYDDSFSWFVLISHHGAISIIKNPMEKITRKNNKK